MRTILLIVLLTAWTNAIAQWLDPTFADAGVHFFNTFQRANSVHLQFDEKILVSGGDGLVWRLMPDGTPDPSFGVNGVVQHLLDCINQANNDLALQSDGKIVVVAHSLEISTLENMGMVFRMHANGDLDNTFADGEGVLYYKGPFDNAYFYEVEVLADDRIVVAGHMRITPTTPLDENGQVLMRLLADGTFDPSFGSGGITTQVVSNSLNTIYDMVILPDGDILTAGCTATNTSFYDVLVSRFHEDGSMDMAFGTGGHRVIAPSINSDQAFCLAVTPDGKFLVGGTYDEQQTTGRMAMILRLNPDGTTDATFANNGILLFAHGMLSGYTNGMQVMADGTIIAAGVQRSTFSSSYARIWAFTADGAVEPSLWANGMFSYGDTLINNSEFTGLVVQPDGKPVAIGSFNQTGKGVLRLAPVTFTGIEETAADISLVVYPNPTTGSFQVDLHTWQGPVTLDLYDTMGRRCMSWRGQGSTTVPFGTEVQPGPYYLKVSDGRRTRSLQLVVE